MATPVGLEPPTSGSGVRGVNHQATAPPLTIQEFGSDCTDLIFVFFVVCIGTKQDFHEKTYYMYKVNLVIHFATTPI